MRIAIDGMLLSRCESGVELSILNLARALAAGGREDYTFMVPRRFQGPDPVGAAFRTFRERVPAHLRLARILWEQLALPSRVARGGFDLLHAPGYLAPLHCPAPVTITVYDLIALTHPRLCRASNRINFRLLLPRSIARARRIVVPSLHTAREVESLFPEAAPRIRVVPLGVGAEFRAERDAGVLDDVRRRLALPSAFVLFVGRGEPKKNLEGLVRAFAEFRREGGSRHKLVIAGARGWGRDVLPASIRSLGLAEEVIFPGFVTARDLPALYSLADVFVFPSLTEGFGLPPLEAMACGTPVICADRGALPEVTGGAALLVDPERPAAIADAMRSVLGDRERRRRLVESGLARAAGHTWARTAEGTEAAFRELGGRPREGGA